jgi:predicted TIM-barrel fold metal-dependent hydrolase
LPGAFSQVPPDGWLRFMDDVGIERAVLYTTGGLALGKVINRDFAIDSARAYNDWFNHDYLKRSDRFQGIGLIPMQEPEDAVKELRRLVEELGFVGAMIPTMGMKGHVADEYYWPVYAEADRLGCCLGIHGGAHEGLGMDYLTPYAPINALGHPFGLMIAFAGIVFNAIFDRFPNVRIGFMEGGVSWFMTCLERFDRSWETHIPYDPRRAFLQLPTGEKVSDYIIRHIKAGRLFVGCEGTEPGLADAIRVVGNEPFIFSSDFPHEVNTEYCRHEIEEIKENPVLNREDKHAVLHCNAEKFYSLRLVDQQVISTEALHA